MTTSSTHHWQADRMLPHSSPDTRPAHNHPQQVGTSLWTVVGAAVLALCGAVEILYHWCCAATARGIADGYLPRVQASADAQPPHRLAAPRHAPSAEGTLPPPPRAGGEARYIRKWLRPHLPDLCEAVLQRALIGDMHATRLLLRLADIDKEGAAAGKAKRTGTKVSPGFAKKALEQFRGK